MSSGKPWTLDEDELLKELVSKCNKNWKEIAKHFDNRSVYGCQKRFNKIDPNFKFGGWEKDEDSNLCDWLFSNVEERITPTHWLIQTRRKWDILKRLDFFRKIICDKLFPEGYTLAKKEESKHSLPKEITSAAKPKGRRKIKEEMKNCEDNDSSDHIPIVKNEPNKRKNKCIKQENHLPSDKVSNPYSIPQNFPSKTMTKDQFLVLAGIEESDSSWTKIEDEQLLELYKALGNDWDSIQKFMKAHTSESIQLHLLNILRWTAYEYKSDFDWDRRILSKQFPNHNELYMQNPLTESEENLRNLLEVACYLLNLNLCTKSESISQTSSINEKDKLRDVCMRKVISARQSNSKNQSFNNPLLQSENKDSQNEVKNTVNKFNWKENKGDDDSDLSSDSDNSGLNLLLNLK